MSAGIVLALGVLVENSETGLYFFPYFYVSGFSWMPEIFFPVKPSHVVEEYLDAGSDAS